MIDIALLIAVATVCYLGIMAIFWKPKKHRQPKQTPNKKEKLTPDDIMEVLEFMKTHNIIDNKQYNELIVKTAPFL